MKAVWGFFKKKWVIQLIGLIALSALLWFVGPLIAVAGAVPLESEWIRIGVIGVLAVGWIILRLVAELRAARKDQCFMAELAKPEESKSSEAQAAGENIGLLRENFEKALSVLRDSRAKGKGDRQFLYELPWYIIIGPPGSGKTTALLNSGLKFPLADKLGNQPIRGVSGTRNCEWMFTDQAILIDTAGRYTTQESYQAVDAAEWNGFLGLLKQQRPRRPINGVLVTLSLSDLLQQTEEERTLHGKAVRQRIQELYTQLGVRFPIYMLLTKCDLVAGFNEFFADLSNEERAQVWGETFPAESVQGEEVASAFAKAFDELVGRLNRRTMRRIQDERDLNRRSQVLDFPQQLMLLKPALIKFIEDCFATNRYESKPLLRGVYFTSGTQEGTPIDRVMGVLASAFRLNRQAAPVYSGQGRSFFLTRLLTDVMFPEAELAGADPKVERRQRLLQTGAYASVGVLALLGLGLWALSYQRNVSALEKVEKVVEQFRNAKIDNSNWQSNLRTLLPKLDALNAVPAIYDEAGLSSRFGLYQGNKLTQASEHSYEHWLSGYFLPLIMHRLGDRMTGSEGANNDVLYELLRVYLMLAQPDRMDAKIAAPWIRSDWERAFASEPEVLAKLTGHLDHLLAMKLDPMPLDDGFVTSIRNKLSQVPQIIQLYARFKNESLLDKTHDFQLGQAIGPQGNRVFVTADGKDVGSLTIPGLFTAWGFTDVFLKNSLGYVKDAVTENWVLGKQAIVSPAEIERLHDDFQRLYLADYQKSWLDLLNAVKLRKPADMNQTVDSLDVLSRPDSPLKGLLVAVEKNTALSKISTAAANLLTQAAQAAGAPAAAAAALDPRMQKLLEVAKTAEGGGAAAKDDPIAAVEAVFAKFNALVRAAGDGPPPVDATLKALGELHDHFLQIGGAAATGEQALKSASGAAAGAGGGAVAKSKAELGALPEPIKGTLLGLTDKGTGQVRNDAKDQLNAMLKSGVTGPCKEAFAGRYPLVARGDKDATLMDFGKFFAPSGLLDQFFQTNLKAFLDTNRPVWTELKVDGQALGLSPAAIRQFQTAAKIRQAFFAAGATPGTAFELKPLELDNNVATFRFNLEGQELVYQHGPEQVTTMKWPGPNAGGGARIVFETIDGRQVGDTKQGAWALFRLLDASQVTPTGDPARYFVTFRAEDLTARFELRAASVSNPFGVPELKSFSCPESF